MHERRAPWAWLYSTTYCFHWGFSLFFWLCRKISKGLEAAIKLTAPAWDNIPRVHVEEIADLHLSANVWRLLNRIFGW